MKGFSAPKNAGKRLAHPEQGPIEKNFRYLKAGRFPPMASIREALTARQTNAGSKAAREETRDIRVVIYSARAEASGEDPGHKIITQVSHPLAYLKQWTVRGKNKF